MSFRAARLLVLASSSPYRRALLERLRLPFIVAAPRIDEIERPGERPRELVQRLAEAKAQALEALHPDALIIGSDQVATLDGEVLVKPGTLERACEQLSRASGRRVEFLTGLCVLDGNTGVREVICEPYAVHFRRLSLAEIQAYVDREQPVDCAGSFKSEGLGIALLERMEGDDPTALVGLPLIQLTRLLGRQGMGVLSAH
ncbi:MAG: Maf family protein [Chromatiales bacterium]